MNDLAQSDFRLGDFLPYQLSLASHAVSNRVAHVYQREFDLKIPEWRVIAMLGDEQQLTQRDLTELTYMDKVAVNRACKVLEERGLICRSPNSNDGRSHMLELTDDGRAMYSEIAACARAMEQRLLKAVGLGNEVKIRTALEKIIGQATEIDPVA